MRRPPPHCRPRSAHPGSRPLHRCDTASIPKVPRREDTLHLEPHRPAPRHRVDLVHPVDEIDDRGELLREKVALGDRLRPGLTAALQDGRASPEAGVGRASCTARPHACGMSQCEEGRRAWQPSPKNAAAIASVTLTIVSAPAVIKTSNTLQCVSAAWRYLRDVGARFKWTRGTGHSSLLRERSVLLRGCRRPCSAFAAM